MKKNFSKLTRRAISVFCVLVLLATPIPLARLLSAGAAEDLNPKRQVADFEDPSVTLDAGSGLEIDGLQDGKGYLYSENTSAEMQYLDLARHADLFTVGESYSFSFDFNTLQMPVTSKIVTVDVMDEVGNTLTSTACKQAYFEDVNRWYHVDLDFTANAVGDYVRFGVAGGANVVFDNIKLSDGKGNEISLDPETAAYNTAYFDWIYKDKSVKAREDNMAFHITMPKKSVSDATHQFSLGGSSWDLKSKLTANANYTLKFDYYYSDSGYEPADIADESLTVLLSKSYNLEGSSAIKNEVIDLTACQPKFNNWQTASIDFTAVRKRVGSGGSAQQVEYYQYLTFTVGAGIDVIIDNIRFIDAEGHEVSDATLDFSKPISYFIDKNSIETINEKRADPNPTADDKKIAALYDLAAVGNNISVDFVSDWVAYIRNTTKSVAVTYIEDEKLNLDTSKDYYVRMQAFIGRNASDSLDNFALQIGAQQLEYVAVDQLIVDEWETYESPVFKGQKNTWLSILTQPGLIAYFDNIEIVEKTTGTVAQKFEIKNVDWDKNGNKGTGVGSLLARTSVKPGLAKNYLLHINTPKHSKDTSVLDVAMIAPQLKNIQTGKQYYVTYDMYYFANEGYKEYSGEMSNEMPTFRLGNDYSATGQPLCVVFRNARSDFLNTDGRYYDQWFNVKSDNFTATSSMSTIFSIKVFYGTECYVDNFTLHDAESGAVMYTIDFEDSVEYVSYDKLQEIRRSGDALTSSYYATFNESKNNIEATKGSFVIEAGPEVNIVDNALYVKNSGNGDQNVYLEDRNISTILPGKTYHAEAEAYIVQKAPAGTSFGIAASLMSGSVNFAGASSPSDPLNRWFSVKTQSAKIPEDGVGCWACLTIGAGFEGYFDNVKIIDDATGNVVFHFTMAIIDEANIGVVKTSIGKIIDRSTIGKDSKEYSLRFSGQTVTVTDEAFSNLKPGISYRVAFNYYIIGWGETDRPFSCNFGNSAENGFALYTTDYRKTGRWEAACGVLTPDAPVNGITFKATAGTEIYVDDLTVTDIETNEQMVYMLFNAKTALTVPSVLNTKAPEKNLMRVAEPDLQAGYLRIGGKNAVTAAIGENNLGLKLVSGESYTVSFDYYLAKASGNIGDEVLSISAVDSVLQSGLEKDVITGCKVGEEDKFWQRVSLHLDAGTYSACDWLQFDVAADTLVFVDNIVVLRDIEETNVSINELVFDTEPKVDSHIDTASQEGRFSFATPVEAAQKGFETNGSAGYLYLDNTAQTNASAVSNFKVKGVKLEDYTKYAVTFSYCALEDTGNSYGIAFGYSNADENNNSEPIYNYIKDIKKGWNSYTVFFETGEVPHAEQYLNIAPYGTYSFIMDKISINEIHNPEPKHESVIDFEQKNDAFYPQQNGFRWATRSEIRSMYPLFNDTSDSNGYLYSYDSHPRLTYDQNGKKIEGTSIFDLYGIPLRSSTVYDVHFRYMIVNRDTLPDDGVDFNFYVAFGTNNGTGVDSDIVPSIFESNKLENTWYTCTKTFTSVENVEPDACYFRIITYHGCAIVFDDFTVTAKVSDYGDLLYCEDIYSQFDNANFDAEINETNWGPLPNGFSVVSDQGGTGTEHKVESTAIAQKPASKVLQIDGNALDARFVRKLSLVSNTNYILSTWVKAEPESDVSLGLFGSSGGRKFTTMYTNDTGMLDFPRDGAWHRVNFAFNSGKFDECYLNITGSNGKIWLDNFDFYLASQGIDYDPSTGGEHSVELTVLEGNGLIPYGKIFETVTEEYTETEYREVQTLSTWEDVTEETFYTNPEVGIKRKKTMVQTGGGISTGGIITIIAGGVFVACAALFVILLLARKRKPEGK